jgi:hypothetical protein
MRRAVFGGYQTDSADGERDAHQDRSPINRLPGSPGLKGSHELRYAEQKCNDPRRAGLPIFDNRIPFHKFSFVAGARGVWRRRTEPHAPKPPVGQPLESGMRHGIAWTYFGGSSFCEQFDNQRSQKSHKPRDTSEHGSDRPVIGQLVLDALQARFYRVDAIVFKSTTAGLAIPEKTTLDRLDALFNPCQTLCCMFSPLNGEQFATFFVPHG